MSNIFLLPNQDKNCQYFEAITGIRLRYSLSCTKDNPNKTGVSRTGRAYIAKEVIIPYQNDMSSHILKAYYRIKTETMLILAMHKKDVYTEKVTKLYYQFKMFE